MWYQVAEQPEEAETSDMLLLIYMDGKSFAAGSKQEIVT